MARYIGPKEKIERRIGEKLFLKGERSYSQKSALVKKPYPPGVHGRKMKGRKLSEYGYQLKAKQKIKYIYRVLEKQFKKYIEQALKTKGNSGEILYQNLERRLDNVIFRLGFSQARDTARQLITHGHFLVNNTPINIPSYQVKIGDEIKVKPESAKNKYFSSILPLYLKKYNPPNWLEVNKEELKGKVKGLPTFQDGEIDQKDIQAIIEFYSR